MGSLPRLLNMHRIAAAAVGVVILGCGNDDLILETPAPPVVIRLTPESSAIAVGDSVRIEGRITGGSPVTPSSVSKCTATSPSVVRAVTSLSACTIVGLAPGTTDIIAMASTGQVDTATVVVVPR